MHGLSNGDRENIKPKPAKHAIYIETRRRPRARRPCSILVDIVDIDLSFRAVKCKMAVYEVGDHVSISAKVGLRPRRQARGVPGPERRCVDRPSALIVEIQSR